MSTECISLSSIYGDTHVVEPYWRLLGIWEKLSRLTLFYVLVCIADLFRVTWKLSSCVCVFNRHVVEMLRLKKGDLSPRSFVYWAFQATEALKERETASSGNNRSELPRHYRTFWDLPWNWSAHTLMFNCEQRGKVENVFEAFEAPEVPQCNYYSGFVTTTSLTNSLTTSCLPKSEYTHLTAQLKLLGVNDNKTPSVSPVYYTSS